MRGILTGDFDELVAIGNRVAKMGSPAAMRALSAELADEALFQIQQGFAQERDPYGRPWYPKKYPDGRKTLRGQSGKLIGSFRRLYVGPDAAIIGSTARHAIFPQTGTGIFGPSGSRIYPKRGKALRFRGPTGGFLYAKSVEGSRQRMMVPKQGIPAPIWTLAIKRRAQAFLRKKLLPKAA